MGVYAGVCRCTQVYIGVRRCAWVCAGVRRCTRVCIGVCVGGIIRIPTGDYPPNHLLVEPRYYHGDGSKITLLPLPW